MHSESSEYCTATPTHSESSEYCITALTQGKRSPDRVNVFLDGKFAFSLHVSQIVDFSLRKGQIITHQERTLYEKASSVGKLYTQALNWLFTRPHSVRETRDYLRRKQISRPEYGITTEDIDNVLDRLKAKNYLNDITFTEYYIENRFLKKGISQRRLRIELIKKGVAEHIIDAALKQAPRDETAEAVKIIAKKRRLKTYNLADTDPETRKLKNDKLIQYLVRQGFDYELSRKLVLETDLQN